MWVLVQLQQYHSIDTPCKADDIIDGLEGERRLGYLHVPLEGH